MENTGMTPVVVDPVRWFKAASAAAPSSVIIGEVAHGKRSKR
jgi:hypothetical protein